MADRVGHPDKDLGTLLREGASLTGWQDDSGAFRKEIKPPVITPQDLLDASYQIHEETVSSVIKSGDPDTAEKVWQATFEEHEKGWIKLLPPGASPPPGVIVSPRFGVNQKGKVRPIDNFSSSRVNEASLAQTFVRLCIP